MRTQITTSVLATALATGLGAAATAAPPFPNEFEQPGDELSPLFAFFGGVTNWGTNLSSETIHSGGSLEVWAIFVDDLFNAAGFAVGTFSSGTGDLAVDAGADTFSITIEAPTNGPLSFAVTLREDDNGDGVIDDANDDEWESLTILLDPGVQVYNLPLSSFFDVDSDVGNNVMNIGTTSRVAYELLFESRDAYPGGQIVGSVSFHIDHVGAFAGEQTLPDAGPDPDLDGDGVVGFTDLSTLLGAWGPCAGCAADLNEDGGVGFDDLVILLAAWGT